MGAMALIETPHIEQIKEMLTLTSLGDRPFTLHLWEDAPEKNRIYVPRKLVSQGIITIRKQTGFNIESKITLTEIQELLIRKWEYQGRNGIIQAPTGTGKTVMGISLACFNRLPTLIIAPTDAIMTQWVQAIKKFTDCEDTDIGIIKQNRCEYRDRKFVIGMIHTLAKDDGRFPKDLYDHFGFVIWDEVHHVGSETFSRTVSMFNSRYRLGLSATPSRRDGMSNVFKWHIGKVVSVNQTIPVKPRVVVVEYYNMESHHKGCVWGGKVSLGKYMNKLVRVKHRTKRIAQYVLKAFAKGHQILVLTDRLEQVQELQGIMLAHGIDREKVGVITHSKKEIHKQIRIGTYGSAGEGLDIPELTCLVLATPRAFVKQAVGRVVRKGGNQQPLVIDFVDFSSHIMQGWAKARMKLYKEYTDQIKVVREDWKGG